MRRFVSILLVASSVLVGCSSPPLVQPEADVAFQNCSPKIGSRSAPTNFAKHNLNETGTLASDLHTPTPTNVKQPLCSPTNNQPITAISLGSASSARPTPRPVIDTTTQLTNLSNMPGADTDVAVALHPIKGWAAVIWAHTPPDEPDNGAVFVRTQDAATGIWQTGISVNTTPTYGFASHPDVAVDPAGRIHVVFAQTYNGHKLYPHYSRSEDGGKTWSAPEPLPTPDWSNQSAGYSRIAVDPQGQLHIFFTVGTGQLDRYRYVEVQRPSAAAPGSAWRIESNIFGGDKETRIALAFVPYERDAVRTVAVTGCNHGCGYAQPIVAIRDGSAGAWRKATIPQAVLQGDLQINWVSAVSFVQPRGQYVVCIAWGLYARSGNFASCSRDQGATWEGAQSIIQTPSAIDNQTYDTGSTPELLYESTTDRLIAVSLYRQAGVPDTVYPVYSYRKLDRTTWTPVLSGPFSQHDPALRLFPTTPRNLAIAGKGIHIAYAQNLGLAVAVWNEFQGDENIDIYLGLFNPSALLGGDGVASSVPTPSILKPQSAPVVESAQHVSTATPWVISSPNSTTSEVQP